MQGLFTQAAVIHFSPVTFITNPATWVHAINRYRATHSIGPNFGYNITTAKVSTAELQTLDLSCILALAAGGEPVHASTFNKFYQKFKQCGLRPNIMVNGYGMAETCVYISGLKKPLTSLKVLREPLQSRKTAVVVDSSSQADSQFMEYLSVGRPDEPGGSYIRIVDPETLEPVSDSKVGEIWINSPAVSPGYYGVPEEVNRCKFRARLRDEHDDGREYLRSGDLGFVFDGFLYCCGRLKDLIIVRGRNIYPHDIETGLNELITRDPALQKVVRLGCIQIIGVPNEESTVEDIVIVAEARPEASDEAELSEAARLMVLETIQLAAVDPRELIFIAARTMNKTTSGKHQRSKTKEGYLAKALKVIKAYPTSNLTPCSITPQLDSDLTSMTARSPGDDRLEKRLLDLYYHMDSSLQDNLSRLLSMTDEAMEEKRKLEAKSMLVPEVTCPYRRMFHHKSVTILGVMRSVQTNDPLIDSLLKGNSVFSPEKCLSVLLRHSNGTNDNDDDIDVRGASLRVYDSNHKTDNKSKLIAGEISDLIQHQPSLLDLLMTTGECFDTASTRDFLKLSEMNEVQLLQWIPKSNPEFSQLVWAMHKQSIDSGYEGYIYYSKGPHLLLVRQPLGEEKAFGYAVRFRLISATVPGADADLGDVSPTSLLPPNVRTGPSDFEDRSTLRDKIKSKLNSSQSIEYYLQIQARVITSNREYDCSKAWAEPWHTIATLTIDQLVPDDIERDVVTNCGFNVWNHPDDLPLPKALSDGDSASIAVVRGFVYYYSWLKRTNRQVPLWLRELVSPSHKKHQVFLTMTSFHYCLVLIILTLS